MRPPNLKQPQVKKELCQVLEYVDVDVEVTFRTLPWHRYISFSMFEAELVTFCPFSDLVFLSLSEF